jgi:hypothetical protein
MPQPNPILHILWYENNISQRINFQFVKVLVDGGSEQRLKLMSTILNLMLDLRLERLRLALISLAVRRIRKAEVR